MRSFWKGEEGFAFSTEMIVVLTIVICGTVVAWTSLREAVVTEMADIGTAIGNLNQSYNINATSGHSGSCSGSSYTDFTDYCDSGDPPGQAARCVNLGQFN